MLCSVTLLTRCQSDDKKDKINEAVNFERKIDIVDPALFDQIEEENGEDPGTGIITRAAIVMPNGSILTDTENEVPVYPIPNDSLLFFNIAQFEVKDGSGNTIRTFTGNNWDGKDNAGQYVAPNENYTVKLTINYQMEGYTETSQVIIEDIVFVTDCWDSNLMNGMTMASQINANEPGAPLGPQSSTNPCQP
ncbi:MAG: hypothetical protein ACPGLV_12815 [Bacteroidia bacterium]